MLPGARSIRFVRLFLVAVLAIGVCMPRVLYAPPLPAWWAQRGATNPNPPDDFAAANLGQLKHIAAKAYEELHAKLPGGAGPALAGLIAAWNQPDPVRDDFAAANLGQLKFIARPFYDRLAQIGYTGSPLAPGQRYPWTDTTTDDDDFSIANLGQLKLVFSFDLDSLDFPPVVYAGPNQAITLPAQAGLNAEVYDPDTPVSKLRFLWSRVRGPGSVTFSDPGSPQSAAS